ncbi:MAG: aromatic ring-hydroxylating dioxygenase subunit alpha [Hyphomonadaceae bacterium]|nr:aromatic ring-hydroxylating dioxygenase subunit alpha [Hyphomonadaceae bacterium]
MSRSPTITPSQERAATTGTGALDYSSPELLRLEKERLWPKIWQMACREEEIPHVGDFVNYKIFGESILVTRTGEHRIQAFYNVCQHRGRRLREDEKGHATSWYCRFHGWKYDLDGANSYVHDQEDWAECPLRPGDIRLKEVKVGTWAGWVWINQDPNAISLKEYLGEVPSYIDPFEWENGRVSWHETIIAPVNWKVIVEAFIENYHVFATHTGGWQIPRGHSRGVVHGRHGMFYSQRNRVADNSKPMRFQDPDTGEWMTPTSAAEAVWAYNRHIYKRLASLTAEPMMAAAERLRAETPADFPPEKLPLRLMELHKEELAKRGVQWPARLDREAIERAGTDWHVFPNSILLPSADSVLWYRLRPYGDDPERCIFDIWSIARYAPGKEPKVERHETVGFDAFRGRNPFLEEDFANIEAVHEGMKSRGYEGPRFNPVQEPHLANFHRVLKSYCFEDGTV